MTTRLRHRKAFSEVLRSRQAFLANLKIHGPLASTMDAEQVLAAYLGAYCAGMSGAATAKEVFSALSAEPNKHHRANATIRTLLGSIRVSEAMRLVTSWGVPMLTLAEHVRAPGLRRPDLIAWLNQFAVPESTRTSPSENEGQVRSRARRAR